MTVPLPRRNPLAAGAMLLLAPTVIAGSSLSSVSTSGSAAGFVRDVAAAHTRFVVGGLLLTLGTYLFIPAAAGFLRLAGGRGRSVATVGAVLTGIASAALGGGYLMRTVVFGMLTPAHTGAAVELQEVGDGSVLGALPFVFAPLLVVGLVLVGIGLFVGGGRPRWLAVALPLTAVALHFAPDSAVGALLHAPLAAVVAAFGVLLLRRDVAAPAEDRAAQLLP